MLQLLFEKKTNSAIKSEILFEHIIEYQKSQVYYVEIYYTRVSIPTWLGGVTVPHQNRIFTQKYMLLTRKKPDPYNGSRNFCKTRAILTILS